MALGKEEEKDKKKLIRFGVVCAVGLVILLIYVMVSVMPLDEITDYQVHVETREDGSLDITYRYQWKVLNDSREGPLSWVQLGVANQSHEVIGFGGAARRVRSSYGGTSDCLVKLDLDRSYYKGETAIFWFQVHQEDMLCINSGNYEEPFYDFTPGWFDRIRIKHYRFTWKDTGNIVSHNADREEDGNLVWEGSLKKGGKRQMKLFSRIDGFTDPKLVHWRKYQSGVKGDGGVDPGAVFLILFGTGYFAYAFSWGADRENYNRGRGYRGGRGGGYHGGGCACACAGCACACACAGGGRAGCSKKDFYHTTGKKEGKSGGEDGEKWLEIQEN